jgi:predicted nucleic acid-binding protein
VRIQKADAVREKLKALGISELIRVLAYPRFQLSAAEQALLLADFLPYAAIITVSSTLADVPRSRDPADQIFLSLAVAGRADGWHWVTRTCSTSGTLPPIRRS